ncbi:phytanoyl-CoA dioxygenase family protein [Gammaproteobacteria bacterium]|jgi:ectoine hydroxylase-related dioxygenase (phytanoyl-CoA dioxygenase family)|nr:phytanoyl-CoA dioxygenase family protein [Gammaproteobacteria bacterium]
MMDFKELSKFFHKNGYVYIKDFFNPNLMDECHDEITTHFKKDSTYKHDVSFIEKSKTDVIPWFPQIEGNNKFDGLEMDQRLCDLTGEILGPRWRSLYCMVMFSNVSSNGQAWHQDCSPDNKKNFNLNRLVYTMDIDASTGGEISLIPGSHKKGLIPAGSATEQIHDDIKIKPTKGSLLLLHGHTWHRVYPVFNEIRVSTNFRCVPENTPDSVTDVAIYRNMLFRFSDGKIIAERH